MFDLTGRKALVTGATGGLGGAIARALHAQGATVALSGTRRAALDGLAADLGERAHIVEANLADKLQAYSGRDDMTIQRLACTPEQIAELALIGGTPKKDTWRHPTLGAQPFIGEAVEVEAIDAPILREVVETAVTSHLDERALEVIRMVEESERQGLLAMARGWSS